MRIRTIKPEFWTDEDLSALPPETHNLAAALLNYADDEGYFNANARLVRAHCCPLRDDATPVETSLDMLADVGYIRLGTADDGKRYGVIVSFASHQVVNRPTASKIKEKSITWDAGLSNHGTLSDTSVSVHRRKGREGKGTEQGREQGTGNRERDRDPTGHASPAGADDVPAAATPDCPHQKIIDLYHECLPELRAVREWNENRRAILRARWREKTDRQCLDWWRQYFRYIRDSDFLMGRAKDFAADLEWLIRPSNMPKVIEGRYHGNGTSPRSPNEAAAAEAKRKRREGQT